MTINIYNQSKVIEGGWVEGDAWFGLVESSKLPFAFLARFIEEYNSLRTKSLRVIYLMLHESMSG